MPAWLGLPPGKNLGLGRHWHGVSTAFWILNGVIYVVLLFATGEWARLIPTSWAIFPGALHSLTEYLTLHIPPASEFHPYDPLQQLAYAAVVFLLGPFMLLTGAAMSPAIAARFPWYLRLFGGRQGARSLHFLAMASFVLFTIVHTALVLLVHFRDNIANIVFGTPTANFGLAVAIALVALLVVVGPLRVGLLVFGSPQAPRAGGPRYGGAPDPTGAVPTPSARPNATMRRRTLPTSGSTALRRRRTRVPLFLQLARDDFRDWRLEVGGLVQHPLSLSLDDIARAAAAGADHPPQLRAGLVWHWQMGGRQSLGYPRSLRTVARARAICVCTSYGLDQFTYGGQPRRPFYEVIDLELARHPQTILAYEFNDEPLPLPHGAPLRLRVETELGYKMVKYLRSIEFVADYRDHRRRARRIARGHHVLRQGRGDMSTSWAP